MITNICYFKYSCKMKDNFITIKQLYSNFMTLYFIFFDIFAQDVQRKVKQ